MKTAIYFILVVMILFNEGINAQENPMVIVPRISHVTVFTNSAQVNSAGDVTFSQGLSNIVIKGLSPYIDQQSIQVRGRGKFIVLSVSYEINYISGLKEKTEIEELRKKIEDLSQKSDEGKMQISILKEEESFLTANKNVNGKQENLDAANFKSLFDFYRSSLVLIRSEIFTTERKVNDIDKELARLRKQLDGLQAKSNLPAGQLNIVVKADSKVTGKLEISYLVQNAGWFPSYDIRVTNLNEPVSVIYKANVFQNTGEDWNNVNLTFSSATPNKSGVVPVLNPYYIDFISPAPVVVGYGTRDRKAAAVMMKSDDIQEETLAPTFRTPVPVGFVPKENSTSIEFRVETPYTIPSEGKSKSIDMMYLELPAVYHYQAVPKFDRDAFLIARIHDWEKFDLLEGEANLYFENTFVGKSVLDVRSVTDTMNISLGRDMGIVIKREKRKNYTSEKLIGNNKVVTLSWEISVRNSKSEKLNIKLSDQIPLSQNKEISVDTAETSGGKLDAKTGIVTWDLDLKPGESKTLLLTYSVKYPKDKIVNID